jgi:uncharacterized alpha-E superfamily protein
MGDAGEGLVDAEARILERIEERASSMKSSRPGSAARDPEKARLIESLRLAKTELQRQIAVTTNATRLEQIHQAVAELDRRLAAAQGAAG